MEWVGEVGKGSTSTFLVISPQNKTMVLELF